MQYYKWEAYWATLVYRTSRNKDGYHTDVELYYPEIGIWRMCHAGPGFWEKKVMGDIVSITEQEAFIEIL